jgi:glycosyltransferase involved in cell wall biosynthesis
MKNPQISIIVPVYNTEKYLCRCIDSILVQTFPSFECILVDDGSSDSCAKICDEYREKDARFKVIHKRHNEGLPRARRSGLDIAAAEFVMHIDSDDWIEPNAIELLYDKQKDTDADIVFGGFRELFSFGVREHVFPEINCDTLVYFFLYNCRSLFGKLYRKSLFDHYIVPPENMGEDAIVNVQIFSKIDKEKWYRINQVVYNYDHHSCGISSQITHGCQRYTEDPAIKCRLWIENYLDGLTEDKMVKSAFAYYMIREGINPYLRYAGTVTKNEIDLFYSRYYLNCDYINRMKCVERPIVPLFHFSILLGRIYAAVLNWLVMQKHNFLR